jgi:hypothetical protein
MFFYSKISLCALLAAGTALGMELPPLLRSMESYEGQARLNAPALSAAAQAINQPMIKIYSPTQHIDTIQRNYLEASATLKNMLEDVDANQALVLPESMIEDYLSIKDLLRYEYRFNVDSTDEKTVIELLKLKTEQQLVAIANGCQRFELNKVGECTIASLAERLNTLERKEECLRKGSFNLNWTLDVARLVANQFSAKKQQLADYFFLIHNLTQGKFNPRSFVMARYIANKSKTFGKYTEEIKKAIQKGHYRIYNTDDESHVLFSDNEDHYEYKCDQAILNKYIGLFTNLRLEQIVYFDYLAQMANNKRIPIPDNRLSEIEATLPDSFIEIGLKRNPYWWQYRSLLTKAAIITGGVAATGLAAWYGYKYFNKK